MTPFDGLFLPEEMREAVSDRAWLQAMLDAERALAKAGALAGALPPEAAQSIAEQCQSSLYDAGHLAREGRLAGNPVEPLVRALRARVGGGAADYVHWGATSQDILDTAAMLVAARAIDLILAETDALAAGCAQLAERHRQTPMAARTLLQQAVPTTFGLKAAGWLTAVVDARRRLRALRRSGLAAQLGGAAGTLGALGERGLEVARLFALELGLVQSPLPWHTSRVRVAELGGALAVLAGVVAKIGLDIALLAQTEVAEVAEPSGGRRGGSSTMPHKRNPVGSVLAVACAGRVRAAAGELMEALVQEHERAAGRWQVEGQALSQALAFTGGAVSAMREVVEGLEVDPQRMQANLESPGLVGAEQAAFLLAPRLGRVAAQEVVRAACERAVSARRALREELLADERVSRHVQAEELAHALSPAAALGAVDSLVERALGHYRAEDEEGS